MSIQTVRGADVQDREASGAFEAKPPVLGLREDIRGAHELMKLLLQSYQPDRAVALSVELQTSLQRLKPDKFMFLLAIFLSNGKPPPTKRSDALGDVMEVLQTLRTSSDIFEDAYGHSHAWLVPGETEEARTFDLRTPSQFHAVVAILTGNDIESVKADYPDISSRFLEAFLMCRKLAVEVLEAAIQHDVAEHISIFQVVGDIDVASAEHEGMWLSLSSIIKLFEGQRAASGYQLIVDAYIAALKMGPKETIKMGLYSPSNEHGAVQELYTHENTASDKPRKPGTAYTEEERETANKIKELKPLLKLDAAHRKSLRETCVWKLHGGDLARTILMALILSGHKLDDFSWDGRARQIEFFGAVAKFAHAIRFKMPDALLPWRKLWELASIEHTRYEIGSTQWQFILWAFAQLDAGRMTVVF